MARLITFSVASPGASDTCGPFIDFHFCLALAVVFT
jgi:hypothetical protein